MTLAGQVPSKADDRARATASNARGRVVVVGAGFGGLATAIRLAVSGVRVTLVERDDHLGGRAGRLEQEGFAFDTGPSVLTMPHLFAELFALAGEDIADHVAVECLDPAYRAVFHDGSVLRVRGSVEAMTEEVRDTIGPDEAVRFRRLADRLRALYEVEYATFIDRNFSGPLSLARPAAMARLLGLGGFRRVYPLVASLVDDWRLRRLFTFQAMYAGMSPYQALGIYAVIAYMDTIAGVYAARGGVFAMSRALGDLAERVGVDVRLSTEVERVDVRGDRARGVVTDDGDQLPADVVVLNADLPTAYRELLPAHVRPARLGRLEYSPSCVVVHLGLDRGLAGAAHHNIHFAEDYRASFDDILAGHLQRDPSWFLSVPTVSDPGLAPGGGEVGFWLMPCPNLQGDAIDWDAQAPREVTRAQRLIAEAGYGPAAEATVTSAVVTPADWARQGMAAGTPFAVSHRFGQTGPFRPRNLASHVAGVVFTGSSTTPGVGVPMVLVSGRLAAERAREQLGFSSGRFRRDAP
ncbi:phytoene desaturase [Egibacter rhizosphaerae]|uniref:Phytoene desaturase n=1 Tax=Egibacter rhizosphaerae TaxID=1670831 RepID=A0A411YD00_9ACTN|nr:phytoene desaturase family protein [Egibacter rhizosphaerae]QBI19042.1 phytoene desaturase [Egibacter rhizosphaerae]